MEVIGTYDPIPKTPTVSQIHALSSTDTNAVASSEASSSPRKFKDIQLDVARAKYWLGVGAQPTDTAWRILSMVGLLEPKYRVTQHLKHTSKPAEAPQEGSEQETEATLSS